MRGADGEKSGCWKRDRGRKKTTWNRYNTMAKWLAHHAAASPGFDYDSEPWWVGGFTVSGYKIVTYLHLHSPTRGGGGDGRWQKRFQEESKLKGVYVQNLDVIVLCTYFVYALSHEISFGVIILVTGTAFHNTDGKHWCTLSFFLPVPEVGSPEAAAGSGTVWAIRARSLAGIPRGAVSGAPKPPLPPKKWSRPTTAAWRSMSIFCMVASCWDSRSVRTPPGPVPPVATALTCARRRSVSKLFSRLILSSVSLVRRSVKKTHYQD